MTLGLHGGFEVKAFEDLTSAGVTSSVETCGASLAWQVTVSNIGTNVVFRLEGSLDNQDFFNLDSSGSDTTITANGTYGYCLNGCPTKYVRVRLVSLSGGTPTVASKIGAA